MPETFSQVPFVAHEGFFLASVAVIFFAGKRLSGVAEEIAERSGMGQATMGGLFFGGIHLFAIGVPSWALETTVLSDYRFPGEEREPQLRLAVVAQYCLGHMLGLEPPEPVGMW